MPQDFRFNFKKNLFLGFAHLNEVPREAFMSGVDIILPPENESDQLAFNSLAIAMQQKSMYGIVRYVYRTNGNPYYFNKFILIIRKLGCIIPYID